MAHSLSTLQRPGHKGVPVFFARVDRAGNITKRHSAAKLQFARMARPARPGTLTRPSKRRARSSNSSSRRRTASASYAQPRNCQKRVEDSKPRVHAMRLPLDARFSYAQDFVYADGLDLTNKAAYDPIGISCRICERVNCSQRAVSPLKSKLSIDPDIRDILPYRIVHGPES